MSGRLAAFAGAAIERRVVRYAHAITVATVAFRDHLLANIPSLDPARVHAIPNGYDPDDFSPVLPDAPSDRFVLTYAGTVYRLTSARGLLAAVRMLHERNPDLARGCMRFIGRIVGPRPTRSAAWSDTASSGSRFFPRTE
jgi:glycosyltransferase involved in cell wall biosynthesis